MTEVNKLERWADLLLDTGKRNNLINFRIAKNTTAEVVYPNNETIFAKCSMGQIFEVWNKGKKEEDKDLSKEEYISLHSPEIHGDKHLLLYATTGNPMASVKNIAKKAQSFLDETGNNVVYLAFGFVQWKEKNGYDDMRYLAPLLLVHVNIVTGSVIDAVKLEISDDDVVINPTFDYLLKAEYGVSMPMFEDDDTLSTYYEKCRNVFDRLGWQIIDECHLGIFSFLKINMYEDLKQNSTLILGNHNIRLLLGMEVPPEDASYTKAPLNPLIDLHTVVEADSSQIEAIEMSKSNRSFVLQGPPGTGKSQTITNIIAEALHDNKKVLFVSEKRAALNVVYDKLKKAGLADFCLELHSHKANKKKVIEELNNTLETPRSTVRDSANDEILRKREAMQKLDAYANELHCVRDNIHLSLFQLYEKYASNRHFPDISTPIADISSKPDTYLLEANNLLAQYTEYIPSIGVDYHLNAWHGFDHQQLSFEDRNILFSDLSTITKDFQELYETATSLNTKYKANITCLLDAVHWNDFLCLLMDDDVITPSLLLKDVFDQTYNQLLTLKKISGEALPLINEITASYDHAILHDIQGEELFRELNGQFSSMFSRIFSHEYSKLIDSLQKHAKTGKKPNYQEALKLSQLLRNAQEKLSAFDTAQQPIQMNMGSSYQGIETDWTHVFASLDTMQKIHLSIKDMGSLPAMTPNELSSSKESFCIYHNLLSKQLSHMENAKNRVQPMLDISIIDLNQTPLHDCLNKLQSWLNDFNKLGNWISFLALLKQLQSLELDAYIQEVITQQLAPSDIVGSFNKSFYKHWIEYILFTSPLLSSFSRIKQDQTVQCFSEKDTLQYEISRLQIQAELSAKRPDLNLVAGGSAVSILRREGNKKRKQMPIRKLLSEIGSLAQILKPCFLMSPLSVSTFLDPEKIHFDMVVFDEASQIFPQDAIGTIYRGNQLIVVGDSRQMPPSNFFNSMVETEEDDDDVTDFESILDICSSVFTTKRLAWHYRSHYEQLIAFSNKNFYSNSLVTFPSTANDHEGIGVDFYPVEGTFDRRTKTNEKEAEFIVDLIYQNIDQYPERSLGVVAFSASQQNLIDRLLSERRENNLSYEWFFRSDVNEPFFIKNLETVQGDERDTIIFSIAYAKDINNKFILNFGPLNKEGGERRLNVAVTRARDNIQLVSSIKYTDINLANTSSKGVHLLHDYLRFAQQGSLGEEQSETSKEHESPFEEEVAQFLKDNGYETEPQVGCSGYRIDLGLKKPHSDNFILAIECDGASYHSSKNARDRDRLRQNVLEKMGWTFYRIWSTEWFKNKAVEQERLLTAVKHAIETNKEIPKTITKETTPTTRFLEPPKEPQKQLPQYKETNALEIIRQAKNDFQTGIKTILETEAPLAEEYLLKRICSYFGREKVTKVVQREYENRMLMCETNGIIRRNKFLYLQNMTEIKLRIPGDKREIKYISIEELADGLYTLIKQNVNSTRAGLYKTLVSLLGYSRITTQITSRLDIALNQLLENNLVKETEGMLSL